MATYTVTTTGDVVDPSDGVLSLREALALADADNRTADRIEFAPAVQGQLVQEPGCLQEVRRRGPAGRPSDRIRLKPFAEPRSIVGLGSEAWWKALSAPLPIPQHSEAT